MFPILRNTHLNPGSKLVIKLSSSVVIQDKEWWKSFAEEIAELVENQVTVSLVTSGARALGSSEKSASSSSEFQYALGQSRLIKKLEMAFDHVNLETVFLLLRKPDTNSDSYSNFMSRLLDELCTQKKLPILNEDDVMATLSGWEWDNDQLASWLCINWRPSSIIILGDQKGVYNRDPRRDSSAQLLSSPSLAELNAVKEISSDDVSHYGRGGIRSKISSIEKVISSGVHVIICQGTVDRPLHRIRSSNIFTKISAKRGGHLEPETPV